LQKYTEYLDESRELQGSRMLEKYSTSRAAMDSPKNIHPSLRASPTSWQTYLTNLNFYQNHKKHSPTT
jgi:hypothetical protein